MKKILQIVIILLFNIQYAQTVFLDDFGTSPSPTAANDYGRKTSPYVPAGSFNYGTSKANNNSYAVTNIDNSYYAVVAPEFIYSGVIPGYYFWTLPDASTSPFQGANRYAEDHTTGDTHGAVLAINAQTPNTAFYERNFSFASDSYYEVSFWIYVVNETTQTRLSIKDPVSGGELGGVSTGSIGTPSSNWQEYKLTFKTPTGSCINTVATLSLQNIFTGGTGNDYYIDDISVKKLASQPSIIDFTFTCPVNSIAVDSDFDGIPDDIDLDDDNDGILDTDEGCLATVTMGEVVTGGGPAALASLQSTGTALFPLNPPGASLPNGGVRVTRNSGGNGWAYFSPGGPSATTTVTVNGTQSAPFPTTYFDIVGTIPRNVTVDFGVSANSLSTANNDYQYIIGIAGLGGEGPVIANTFSVPLTVVSNSDVFGGGRYSLLDGVISTTPGQTGNVVSTNIGANADTQGYTFYFIPKSAASFTMDLTGGNDPHGFIFGVYNMNCTANTDGDAFPNHLDVDSDGDGCPDAIEGSEFIKYDQVHALNLPVTDPNYNYRGQIKVLANGTTPGLPSQVVSKTAAANGVPELVNPSVNNTSGNVGMADNTDIPPTSEIGQGIGSSQDATVNQCVCYNPANINGSPVLDTQHGITSLNRAGTTKGNWPMARKGAWTALESKTKGFVPNRLTAAQIDAIPANELVEGMMVYNVTLDCLQINTTGTAAGWKCFTTQTCPTLN